MSKTAPEGFAERVRSSFARQLVMKTIGATLSLVEPGHVEITLPFSSELSQQDGFVHAGIISTILDSACGYAAYSLVPANVNILTVEFKINLIRPAVGEKFRAVGTVHRAGKTLTICHGDVFAVTTDGEKEIATMLGTFMALPQG